MDESKRLQPEEVTVDDLLKFVGQVNLLKKRVDDLEAELAALGVRNEGSYDFAESVTGYSRNTLYNKVTTKQIPYELRLGRPWFIRYHLEEWMKDKSYNDEYWTRKLVIEPLNN